MKCFRVDIAEPNIHDLRRRLAATRWPAASPDTGWERGVPLDHLKELAGYWRTDYDWRAAEARLNQFPQFTTVIDGANVHFMHVRSPEQDALPLLITHGWPSSVADFLEVIGPLTRPRAYGANPAEAFHLVIPSLPGFGFSGPTPGPGWDAGRIAAAWAELMRRLGYHRYAAQGGDLGTWISLRLADMDGAHVVGVHVNFLLTPPPDDLAKLDGVKQEDLARLSALAARSDSQLGFMKVQTTRPQTLAYCLTDSPAGQLAWIAEKYAEWTDPQHPVSRDQILTNISIYWLTATAGSSAQLYFEMADLLPTAQTPTALPSPYVPLGVAAYAHDALPIRRFAERRYPNIVHWREYDRGGHFPAMEVPELFAEDLRSFARALR
jgi:epoxide hydrolase